MNSRKLLERWMTLCAICALAVTALVYPMSLQNEMLIPLGQWFYRHGWGEFFENQLRPVLRFGYHPLVLKETLGALVAYLMFLAYWPWKLLVAPARKEKIGLHFPLLIMIGLAGVSLIQTPSFSISLKTLEAFIPGALFFLMVSDLDWGYQGRRKVLVALTAIGMILTLVGLFQIIPFLSNYYYRFFLRFQEARNSLPGLIGHNTEMSSYVLSTSLAALALLLTTHRRWVKVLLTLFLVGAYTVIIAGQSRVIWPLSIILPAALLVSSQREKVASVRLVHVLGALAIILLLCLPFAGQLRERVKRYSPTAMLEETRTRILFASQEAIRERMALGHGVGSFASVYPTAQADYFARHPDSLLAPTDKRTPQAHNDYLQVAVELGFLGLLLTLAGIFLYVRYGAQGTKRLRDPRHRILSRAFGLIVIQHLLNAMVNFPLHVAPAAYLICLSMGIWVAAGREANYDAEAIASEKSLPRNSLLRIGLLVISLLPLAGAPVIWTIISRELVASTHFEIGTGLLNNLAQSRASAEEKSDLFNQAQRQFKIAERLEPLNWEVQYYLAWVDLEHGKNAVRQYQRHKESTDSKARALSSFLASTADLQLRHALGRLEPPYAEVQFHQTFLLKAQIYQELDRLAPGKYEKMIRDNLELAVRYSPVYYEGLDALLRYYSRPASLNPARQVDVGKKMFQASPDRFRQTSIDRAWREFYESDYRAAAEQLDFLSRVIPGDAEIEAKRIDALICDGRIDQAISLLGRLEAQFGKNAQYWHSLALLRYMQGQDEEALHIARQHGALADPPEKSMVVIASLILQQRGNSKEVQEIWNRAFSDDRESRLHRLLKAHLALLRPEYHGVAESEANALAEKGYAPGGLHYVLGKIAFTKGDYEDARKNLQQAAEMDYRASQSLQEMMKQMAERDEGE